MKHILPLLLALLLFTRCNNQQASAEALSKTVAEMNKKCPQVIDSETRLDGLEFKAPNTLRYNYTLLHINLSILDTHQFRTLMWPGLLSTVKVSEQMKKLRDDQVTIEYYYQDLDKHPVYLFTIRPEDYN